MICKVSFKASVSDKTRRSIREASVNVNDVGGLSDSYETSAADQYRVLRNLVHNILSIVKGSIYSCIYL